MELCITGKNDQQMRAAFDKLAAGGKVKLKLEKQFWGDTFGSLTDKFGVDWMFNITAR